MDLEFGQSSCRIMLVINWHNARIIRRSSSNLLSESSCLKLEIRMATVDVENPDDDDDKNNMKVMITKDPEINK